MLNSQQIIVFIPLLEKLQIPANSLVITKQLVKIYTFDLIPTEFIDEMIWYFPDADAFNLNFEMEGMESTLLLANIGFLKWLIGLNISLIVIHIILYPLRNSCRAFKWANEKIGGYLYFDGLLRLYMEIFFDIAMISCLNLYTADWDSLFEVEKESNYQSVVFVILISALPPTLVLIYCLKPNFWRDKKFQQKYGAFL